MGEHTDPEKLGGVPTVRVFRVSADTVVENHASEISNEEIAHQFTPPLEDVRSILAFAKKARQVAYFSSTKT